MNPAGADPFLRTESRFVLPFPPESAISVLVATLALLVTVLALVEVLRRRHARPAPPAGPVQAMLLAVLVLTLCETALRLHLWMVDAGPYRYDPGRDWRLQPNLKNHTMASPGGPMLVSTNSLGLRDRELPPRVPGEVRILCLGDSWTIGHGVREEDCFVRQLDGLLARAEPGARVHVLNAGQHGYSVIQAYALFDELLPLYQPDVVLLCGFNEYSDSRRAEAITVHAPGGVVGGCINLLSRSMVYLTLKKMAMDRRVALADPAEEEDGADGPRRFVSLEQMRVFYQLFIDVCRERGIRLVMFDHAWPGPGAVSPPRHAILSRLAPGSGAWSIELHPASLSSSDPRFWVSSERTHPSARGHREMAEILARFLREQGCLHR